MHSEISCKAQNALNETEKIIRRLAEVYRKELCESLNNRFANFESYFFHPSDCAIIDPYHKVCELYSSLCDKDKEDFRESFTKIARLFGV